MDEESLLVVNTKDLESALDSIIDNLNLAIRNGVKMEDFRIPVITIKVADGNPEHNSTISGTMMKSFVGFQNEISHILTIAYGRELTHDEAQSAELRVKVEQGSTKFLLDLYSIISAGVPNMTLDQTIIVVNSVVKAVGIICASGILTVGVKLFSKERILKIRGKQKESDATADLEVKKLDSELKKAELEYKKNQDELAYKERIAQIEKDKATITSMRDMSNSILTSIEEIVVHSSSAGKYVYRGLAKEAESSQVSIGETTYQTDTLKQLGTIERRPRLEKEEKVVHVKGKFKTELISYVDDAVRKVNISGTAEDGEYYSLSGLPVSKETLTPQMYELINEGTPLYWNFDVVMKGDEWKSMMLLDLKKPEEITV